MPPLLTNIIVFEEDLLDHFPFFESDPPVAGAWIENMIWGHVPLQIMMMIMMMVVIMVMIMMRMEEVSLQYTLN